LLSFHNILPLVLIAVFAIGTLASIFFCLFNSSIGITTLLPVLVTEKSLSLSTVFIST